MQTGQREETGESRESSPAAPYHITQVCRSQRFDWVWSGVNWAALLTLSAVCPSGDADADSDVEDDNDYSKKSIDEVSVTSVLKMFTHWKCYLRRLSYSLIHRILKLQTHDLLHTPFATVNQTFSKTLNTVHYTNIYRNITEIFFKWNFIPLLLLKQFY